MFLILYYTNIRLQVMNFTWMTLADKSSSERVYVCVAPTSSPVLDLLLFALFSILVSISASSGFETLKLLRDLSY